MARQKKIQLGKQGITDNFIETVKNYFKNHKFLKIAILQSAREEGKKGREQVKEYAEKLVENLGKDYKSKIIGFVIAIRRGKKQK